VSVLPGERLYAVVNATFGYDSTYTVDDLVAGIQKVLGVNSGKPNVKDDQSGLFSLHRRDFGQREYATSIAGTIQEVPGVVWAKVTRFESLGVTDDPTTLVPPVSPVIVNPIVSCSAQQVLSLYFGHLQLSAVAEILPEVKK
jgi:hypothetical protein